MSIILRAARPTLAVARAPAKNVRFAHFENVVDQTIPGGTANRKMFALRFIIFTAVGSGLPFVAWKWQLYKSSGDFGTD